MFATLLGPVLAVQAQKFLERRRDQKQRRTRIFHILMTTRAATLSPAHVEAFNAIPLEFYGEGEILTAWRVYLDHHLVAQDMMANAGWWDKRADLLPDLLGKMVDRLGYAFDPVQLKKEFYAPQVHRIVESEQEMLRRGLVKLFSGETALPVAMKVDDAEAAEWKELRALALAWLRRQDAPKV